MRLPPPIVTASIQATLIGVCSNTTAQILNAWQKSQPLAFSWPDFIRFIIYTALTAPPNYAWQILLERILPARGALAKYQAVPQDDIELISVDDENKEADEAEVGIGAGSEEKSADVPVRRLSWRNTFAKWFIDCITIGALWNTLAFFVIIGLLKGQSMEQIWERTRKDTIPLIIESYKIWPAASVVNFTLIPVERRLVFLSIIGYSWDIILSLVAAKE